MTVMTQAEIEALLKAVNSDGGRKCFEHCGVTGCECDEDEEARTSAEIALISKREDLARTALALHQQLADAQAAQAMVVERAAEVGASIAERTRPDGFPEGASNAYHSGAMDVVDAIRALADPTGVEALAALRELLEAIRAQRDKAVGLAEGFEAERDALAAKLAAAEARVGALKSLLRKSDDALDGTEVNLNGDDVFRSGDDYYTLAWLRTQIGAALTTPAEETKG